MKMLETYMLLNHEIVCFKLQTSNFHLLRYRTTMPPALHNIWALMNFPLVSLKHVTPLIKILLSDNCVNPRYTSQNFEPMPLSLLSCCLLHYLKKKLWIWNMSITIILTDVIKTWGLVIPLWWWAGWSVLRK
jgi:hypothetical protein